VNRALWLLIGLQLRGWLRYLVRSLLTLKGALLALVGVMVFIPWLASVLLLPHNHGPSPEQILRYGPAGLLVYCLVSGLFGSQEGAVYFNPSEIDFLFTGPFSRRQLLAYKIASSFVVALPSTVIVAALFRMHAAWYLAAYVGLVLLFLFMQLFAMAVSLLASTVGARLYSRGRKFALLAVLALAALGIWQAVREGAREDNEADAGGLTEALARLERSGVWQTVSQPLRWYFEAFLANDAAGLLRSALPALLELLVLLGVVFFLDAQYLEASAASSARIYARLQRLRRRGPSGAIEARGSPRFSLPSLPWWGGIGPVLWRQLTTALRGVGAPTIVFLMLVGLLLGPMLAPLASPGGARAPAVLASLVGIGVLWLTVFLPGVMLHYDFRGDVDQMVVLKTLPLPAWRLAVAQILTPMMLMTVFQWAVLAGAFVLTLIQPAGEGPTIPIGEALLTGAAFAVPFNFLVFAVENGLFLLFPTRPLTAVAPGDFQALGRSVLFAFAKLTLLGAVALMASGIGALAYLVTGGSWTAALAVAWLVTATAAAAMVPLVALAFQAFDVSRDTPA
jgi:hypothetical protein